ncbi:MAG: dipeptidyl aminopeptidase/acylaminoacyl peptidase [Alteromonadaceae bacterium]|jgi:dipeptidyl aminopeptidase/acylaminoacyl peptidase
MKIIKFLPLALSCLFFLQTSRAQDQENILTVDALSQLNQIQTMVVSPNGKNLVYSLKKGIKSSDNHLYIRDIATGNERQLTTHKEAESNVQYAADSKSLYFLSSRSGSSQVWQLALNGGEAQQITNLPLDVNGFVVANDQESFALEITVKPGCSDFSCTLAAQTQDQDNKHNVRVYDQLMVRHWDTWNTGYKNHLFVAKKTNGKQIKVATDLIPDWFADIAGIDQVSFSPDAKNLVFSAKAPSKEQAWTTNFDLFEVNLTTNKLTNITIDNKAWDAKPVYSKNGRYLAYLAMTIPGYESDKFSIKVRDNTTGNISTIANQWDRSVSELIFADDNRTLYVTAQDIGQKSIFEINPEFGDVRSVYNVGTSSNIAVVDDKIYFTRHSLNTPTDIFVINRDSYGVKQLTNVNKDKLSDIRMAEYKQFSFKGWQDEDVHGYWLKPANYQQGQKYPIAFLVHGGPQGSFGNMFHYRWNAQLWAAQGYGVVMIDFHGSTGYGQKFTDSIAGDWGGKPLEDLQKGLAYIVKAEPWLDANNACALGASYGGYMMNWIAGHWPEGFKCLVNHAGLYDMPSFYTSTEELWFPEHDMGGPVWQGSDDYSKFNPSAFVNNWKTPMLVIQGELDYRVPYAQSLGAFTTLQRKGIDSRLVMFPGEDHHIRDPDNLKFWYQEVFNWLDKYMKTSAKINN